MFQPGILLAVFGVMYHRWSVKPVGFLDEMLEIFFGKCFDSMWAPDVQNVKIIYVYSEFESVLVNEMPKVCSIPCR